MATSGFFASLGVGPLAGAQSSPAGRTNVQMQVPAQVGVASLRDSATLGDAKVYKFVGPGINAFDVFVWSLPEGARNRIVRDSLLRQEMAKFKEAATLGVHRGWYDRFTIAFEDSLSVRMGRDLLPGYVVATMFDLRGERFVSFCYVFLVGDEYLKLRLTIPGEQWDSNPALELPDRLVKLVAQAELDR